MLSRTKKQMYGRMAAAACGSPSRVTKDRICRTDTRLGVHWRMENGKLNSCAAFQKFKSSWFTR